MAKRLRRAGFRWRLLVHEYDGTSYGTAHHVSNIPPSRKELASEWRRDHVLEGTEFDELVVSHWLHIEEMDTGSYWMVVGGVTINIRVDRDGNTKSVLVEGPDDNHGSVKGAEYRIVWNGREERHIGSGDGD